MSPRQRILLENLLIFSAHFIGGAISLLFARYSVYAVPIWISSGIALTAVLLIGKRILPGIIMASVLLNPDLLLRPFCYIQQNNTGLEPATSGVPHFL